MGSCWWGYFWFGEGWPDLVNLSIVVSPLFVISSYRLGLSQTCTCKGSFRVSFGVALLRWWSLVVDGVISLFDMNFVGFCLLPDDLRFPIMFKRPTLSLKVWSCASNAESLRLLWCSSWIALLLLPLLLWGEIRGDFRIVGESKSKLSLIEPSRPSRGDVGCLSSSIFCKRHESQLRGSTTTRGDV